MIVLVDDKSFCCAYLRIKLIMSNARELRKFAVRGGPLQQKALELLGQKPGPTVEEVRKAIHEHSQEYKGPRQGWQAKAASWVKKMHVNRGHVDIGSIRGGKYVVDEALLPKFVVPDLKDFSLRPYVVKYDMKKAASSVAATK